MNCPHTVVTIERHKHSKAYVPADLRESLKENSSDVLMALLPPRCLTLTTHSYMEKMDDAVAPGQEHTMSGVSGRTVAHPMMTPPMPHTHLLFLCKSGRGLQLWIDLTLLG